MGLDVVELVIGVEEVFQIAIPDDEAPRLHTPQALVDYVCARVETSGIGGACLTQRTFHALRGAVMKVLARPRAAIAPATLWDASFPATGGVTTGDFFAIS